MNFNDTHRQKFSLFEKDFGKHCKERFGIFPAGSIRKYMSLMRKARFLKDRREPKASVHREKTCTFPLSDSFQPLL